MKQRKYSTKKKILELQGMNHQIERTFWKPYSKNENRTTHGRSLWNCKTPRVIEMIPPAPGEEKGVIYKVLGINMASRQLYQSVFGQENRSHSRYTNGKGFNRGTQRLKQLMVEDVKVRAQASKSSDSQEFTCKLWKISALWGKPLPLIPPAEQGPEGHLEELRTVPANSQQDHEDFSLTAKRKWILLTTLGSLEMELPLVESPDEDTANRHCDFSVKRPEQRSQLELY